MTMIKNAQWDTKTKITAFLILFFTVLTKIFYFTVGNEWDSAKYILIHLAATVSFSVFVALTLTEKGNKIFSAQGIIMTAAAVMTLGVMISRKNMSDDISRMLVLLPVILLCSQRAVLTPVSAAVSVILAVKYSGTASICLPAAAGISLIYLSDELKDSAVWKKVLVAVSEAVTIGAAVYAFWYRRYFLTVHSAVTQVWDSVATVLAIAILITLAVVSVKRKKPVAETAGYIISAAFSAITIFMYDAYSFPAGAAMLMMLAVICQNGLLLEELGENALKLLCSKLKK